MKIVNKLFGCLILTMLFALPVALHAQTAARLEALFETEAINWEQAAAFVLEASDTGGSVIDAFHFAAQQQWLPKNVSPEDTALLNGVALLLMRSFDLPGGVFYSMFKSPHHAYRELVYINVIRRNTDPRAAVSGQQMLLMIDRILAMAEE